MFTGELQVLVLATFLLALLGRDGALPVLGPQLDLLWLGWGCLVAWLVILPATILGNLLGDGTAWRTVSSGPLSLVQINPDTLL